MIRIKNYTCTLTGRIQYDVKPPRAAAIRASRRRGMESKRWEHAATRFVGESTNHPHWLQEEQNAQIANLPYPRHVRWATCHDVESAVQGSSGTCCFSKKACTFLATCGQAARRCVRPSSIHWFHTRITVVAACPVRAAMSRYDKPVSRRPIILSRSKSFTCWYCSLWRRRGIPALAWKFPLRLTALHQMIVA